MRLPEPMHSTVPAIFRWHESKRSDPLRAHLGASVIGKECARAVWYSFRWAETAQFDGRMLRLFQSGELSEGRIVSELRAIGVTVWDKEGDEQFRRSLLGGHFSGAVDAIAQGFLEAPKATAVCEFKTHNAKSFAALAKKGVREARPQHFAQCQVLMLMFELERCAYIAVNKDTDEMHFEWLHLDKHEAQRWIDRAEWIITSAEPPPRLSEEADHFVCKFCEFHSICHGAEAPLVNCRTCAHSTPMTHGEGGRWDCERGRAEIHNLPKAGCNEHRYIPILLERFAEAIDAADGNVEYRNKLTGETFCNGELSSAEIRACKDKAMLGQERVDPKLKALREEFGAVYG